MRRAALVLAALALGGCETTAEKSAKLQAAAKRVAGAAGPGAQAHGLHIARASSVARVSATAVVHSSEGTVAVVSIHNSSSHALRDVPIEITVHDARGAAIYSNTAPGLGSALVSVSSIPARADVTWVDDQIQAAGTPASVSAVIGQSADAFKPLPTLVAAGAHVTEDPSAGDGAAGTLVNRSQVTQRELVVYAVARRGSRVVAAGRAVLSAAPAGASTPFELFFIGKSSGARLQVDAPATTLE